MTTVGSFCTGYGGLEMGLGLALGPLDVAWHAESDPDAARVLARHWPTVPNLGDLTAVDWASAPQVDIVTAGFPCQPVSPAGRRRGQEDERWLWDDIARAVGVLRPGYLLLENVSGLLSLGIGRVLGSLAGLGYDTTWGVVRASAAGAPHRRERVFILAYADSASRRRPVGSTREVQGAEVDGGPPQQPRRLRRSDPHTSTLAVAYAHFRGDEWPTPDADHRADDGQRSRPQPRPGSADAADPDGDGLARLGWQLADEYDLDRRCGPDIAWGRYEPAIQRWERTLGRAAPRPTEPGRSGERLAPRFVEWMQGLPDGHVTATPGLSRNAQLRILGNGVVPQQAALAVSLLTSRAERAA